MAAYSLNRRSLSFSFGSLARIVCSESARILTEWFADNFEVTKRISNDGAFLVGGI